MQINNFNEVFDNLKEILKKYEKYLSVHADNNSNYILVGSYSEKYKKELWFGGVQIKKNYVSYHLIPVYMYMDLTKKIPEALKKRMQGKSCFNFTKIDKELFKLLGELTEKSYKLFRERGENIAVNC